MRTWLFKIDDERGSRGTAYIDLQKLHQAAVLHRGIMVFRKGAMPGPAEHQCLGSGTARLDQGGREFGTGASRPIGDGGVFDRLSAWCRT